MGNFIVFGFYSDCADRVCADPEKLASFLRLCPSPDMRSRIQDLNVIYNKHADVCALLYLRNLKADPVATTSVTHPYEGWEEKTELELLRSMAEKHGYVLHKKPVKAKKELPDLTMADDLVREVVEINDIYTRFGTNRDSFGRQSVEIKSLMNAFSKDANMDHLRMVLLHLEAMMLIRDLNLESRKHLKDTYAAVLVILNLLKDQGKNTSSLDGLLRRVSRIFEMNAPRVVKEV